MATTLWQVMQLVEANRHGADQLEEAASRASADLSALLSAAAVRRREIADQIYALWQNREFAQISPLRWPEPDFANDWDRANAGLGATDPGSSQLPRRAKA
jgi:hypothetical protein